MNSEFDIAKFSNLLRLAIGERSQLDFSAEIQISKEHLSRLLNQKSSVPAPSTLRNIALASEGRVSYIDLLLATNYINHHDLSTYKTEHVLQKPDTEKKVVTATLMTALSDISDEWAIKNNTDFDITIEFSTSNNKWFFLCSYNTINSHINLQLQYNYFQVIKTQALPKDKFSFVTASQEEFIAFCKQLPYNLFVNLSVILIDPYKLEILKETTLITNSEITHQLPSFVDH